MSPERTNTDLIPPSADGGTLRGFFGGRFFHQLKPGRFAPAVVHIAENKRKLLEIRERNWGRTGAFCRFGPEAGRLFQKELCILAIIIDKKITKFSCILLACWPGVRYTY